MRAVTHSVNASWATYLFLRHFEVICTTTWNLFVKLKSDIIANWMLCFEMEWKGFRSDQNVDAMFLVTGFVWLFVFPKLHISLTYKLLTCAHVVIDEECVHTGREERVKHLNMKMKFLHCYFHTWRWICFLNQIKLSTFWRWPGKKLM